MAWIFSQRGDHRAYIQVCHGDSPWLNGERPNSRGEGSKGRTSVLVKSSWRTHPWTGARVYEPCGPAVRLPILVCRDVLVRNRTLCSASNSPSGGTDSYDWGPVRSANIKRRMEEY